MAYKIQHAGKQLRFPNRREAERYARAHGGLEHWTITVVDHHEPLPVVIQPAGKHT